MSAAHAEVPAVPSKGGKHRTTRTRRLPNLPTIPRPHLPHRDVEAKPAKPVKTERRTIGTARVTPTGQAMYSVDSTGAAQSNIGLTVAGKFATFTTSAGEALRESAPGGFWIELFETVEQRERRVNTQAVAQTLVLAGSLAAKIAAKRAR